MILVTAKEARHLDQIAMETYGIPEMVLMENAGSSVVRLMEKYISWDGKDVVVVCGTGNNGGDGFVIARYAKEAGARVSILLMGNESHMSEASTCYRRVDEKMYMNAHVVTKAQEAVPWLQRADIIVDALIGTGLKRKVEGEKADLIEEINNAEGMVIAVDMPSGMDSDTGQALGTVVEADFTVALGSMKRGHFLYPGSNYYVGKLLYSSIGIPDVARADKGTFPVQMVNEEEVASLLPVRNQISHKGQNGFIGIMAGSAGMEGAALLAGQGALYSGGGKIAVVTVDPVAQRLVGKVPELMISSLGSDPHFTQDMIESAWEKAKDYDVLAMGPGLGRTADTGAFVKYFVEHWEKTLVLDADALYAVAKEHMDLSSCPGHLILTPHVGEFSTLTGIPAKEVEAGRIDQAISYARQHKVTLVLKGAPTVTAFADGRAYVNTTGNPGMASGGMGDTLTGIIAALAGQGLEAESAAFCGVYLHGKAGDLLAKETPVGYTASELARKVPMALEVIKKEL